MVLLTDRLRSTGLAVPPLEDETVDRLAQLLPPMTYQSNPVDTGRPGATFPEVLATVATDPAVDVLTVIGLLEPDTFDLSCAVRSVTDATDVHVVAVVGGPPGPVADARTALAGDGIAAYPGVAGAVTGLRALVDDARGRADRTDRADPLRLVVPDAFRIPVGEDEGKDLLDWLGLATPGRLACDDRAQARSARHLLRPPLAVKMLEPVVAHKRRAGGVHLGVVSEHDMDTALDALDRAGARRYLVEEMAGPGVDLILGARRDPVFGSVVVVGLGGDEAEALDAVAVRLAPLSERQAAGMLDELPGADRSGAWSDRVDPRKVATAVATLGALLIAVPDIGELEINPLRVTADGRLTALDVVVTALSGEPRVPGGTAAVPVLHQAQGGQ